MKKKGKRPSWERYFMDITALVAKRSTCTRREVGAVLLKNKRILATGYNGAPTGISHCIDVGCLREELNVASGERQGKYGVLFLGKVLVGRQGQPGASHVRAPIRRRVGR